MPPQLPHGSFLVTDADELGLSRKQLSRDGIFTPSRGIRLPLHSTGTTADNVRAYTRLDPGCVLTHSAAARPWCICLPGWLDADWRIHIARPADSCKPRRRNVVGHQLSFKEGEVMMSGGVRLTSPAGTWLDLWCCATVLAIQWSGPMRHTRSTGSPFSMTVFTTAIRTSTYATSNASH
ncbi:MAG TPA: hypothetical protein VIM08_11715 [Arthrobacter sp.]|jgi:hypothetical protein